MSERSDANVLSEKLRVEIVGGLGFVLVLAGIASFLLAIGLCLGQILLALQQIAEKMP